MKPERLVKKSIRKLSAYQMAEPAGFRMDTNANLLGANPVVTRFLGQFDPLELNEYPTPHSDLLRKRLSQAFGLAPEQFIAGNGADELLDLVIKCFIDPGDRLAITDPTFGMYEVFGSTNCAETFKIPLKADWSLDAEAVLASGATAVLLCTPNNPTGNSFAEEDVLRIIREFRGIVVVDEAYGEYARKTYLPLVDRFRNLVVLKTFSKAYGLAGLRVGYAAASRALTAQMYKAKAPYNLNAMSEGIAASALRDRKFMLRTVRRMEKERPKMSKRLEALGLATHPSETNFILARSPIRSRTLCRRLLKRGLVIRDLGWHPRLPDHVRITLGTGDQNRRLLKALARALDQRS